MSGKELRNALQNERELLLLMTKLSENELSQLLSASEKYANAMRVNAESRRMEASNKNKELDLKKKEEETKRLSKEQEELTRQKEIEHRERRLTQIMNTEEEKKRIQIKLDAESAEIKKRLQTELEMRKEFNRLEEERLRKDAEYQSRKFKAKEEERKKAAEQKLQLLRKKLQLKAEVDRETEIKMADFRRNEKLKEFESTKEARFTQERQLQQLKLNADLDREKLKFNFYNDFFSGEQGKRRMWNIVSLVSGCLGAYFGYKTVYPLAQKALKNYFFRPKLVSKSVRHSKFTFPIFSKPTKKIFLPPTLQKRMDIVMEGTRNTASRGGYFGHLLMYGLPGTGKTLFAQKMAEEAGMDFALMSGPSFDQFSPKEAIVEIKSLFDWANQSKRGLLLFVDEADSFLEDRSTLYYQRVRVLNEWISQTGTETKKFMCVYATNRPNVLDPAIHSRITRSVEIVPPSEIEIIQMLKHYVQIFLFNNSNKKNVFLQFFYDLFTPRRQIRAESLNDPNKLEEIARLLAAEKFVGRDVTSLVIALAQVAYSHPEFLLEEADVDRVIQEQIDKKVRMEKYLQEREIRLSKS